ncbi:RNA-directed DNA polymerase, eukaryota, reverse transcriptase zinc-binding domain protein [Tanacetum coccineum]
MGTFRSKEDDVQQISTSVFVTNFPDQFSAKDLWNTCKQYGYVVDAFILNRKSKAGKRFGFVRFIKIFDVDRLVNNLCTLWVGRHKIHSNLARFQRPPLYKNNNQAKIEESRHNLGVPLKSKGPNGTSNSYAHVVKGSQSHNLDSENIPAMMLDDSCLNQQNFNCCLMGKVKNFESLSNLKVVLVNEGFDNIDLKYMGGYWVMIKFQSEEAKKTFQSNVGIGTWFAKIQQASTDFFVEGRVAWVYIEGVPLKMWYDNTFKRIASKWGTLIHADSHEDGNFTFGFYRRYWNILESDVVDAVTSFFHHGQFPKGSNSSFIALIPKTRDANMIKDFRPISLIGSIYKIIAKILANRLVLVLGDLVNEVQSAFIADRQILDGPFILNEIVQWGSVIVNGSPTEEFQFHKGLKQGDPLSPFLFILVMETLHISFQRIVDVGLRRNMSKSKLTGIYVEADKVAQAARKIGCVTLKTPFTYLDEDSFDRSSNEDSATYGIHSFTFFNGSGPLAKKPTLVKWTNVKVSYPSIWLDIVKEVDLLKKRGLNLFSFVNKKVGNGSVTLFWEETWHGDVTFKFLFPRAYALESCKNIDVASKLSQNSLAFTFRREPRGGVEQDQFDSLKAMVEGTSLVNIRDRWIWSLQSSGDFTVASIRKLIDEFTLSEVSSSTRWIKAVPIKVNVLAWKIKLDNLPTRLNISRREMDIDSILCPTCGKAVESTRHIFFTCQIARDILHLITSWWNIPYMEVSSYEEWLVWILSLRLSIKHKRIFEGVCYVTWWHIWNFRNKTIFGSESPSKATIFDEVQSRSFYWCRYTCKAYFS